MIRAYRDILLYGKIEMNFNSCTFTRFDTFGMVLNYCAFDFWAVFERDSNGNMLTCKESTGYREHVISETRNSLIYSDDCGNILTRYKHGL